MSGKGETEHPVDSKRSAVARLRHQADRLESEDLFPPLALSLADFVGDMASHAIRRSPSTESSERRVEVATSLAKHSDGTECRTCTAAPEVITPAEWKAGRVPVQLE